MIDLIFVFIGGIFIYLCYRIFKFSFIALVVMSLLWGGITISTLGEDIFEKIVLTIIALILPLSLNGVFGNGKKDAEDNTNENHSPAETGEEIDSGKSSPGDALCECGHDECCHSRRGYGCFNWTDGECKCKKFASRGRNENN